MQRRSHSVLNLLLLLALVVTGCGGGGAATPTTEPTATREPVPTFTPSAAPEETRAFIERARRVVAAGRPRCPLCGQPLNPTGHICPRHNGYHRRPGVT